MTFYTKCAIISVSRGKSIRCDGYPDREVVSVAIVPEKTVVQIHFSLLTNSTKCAIIKTLREGKQPERKGSPREQVRLSRQRLSLARCVGLRVINVSQSPKAEEMWDYADYKAVP